MSKEKFNVVIVLSWAIFVKGQLIENHGHSGYSKHSVRTEDGYLVNLFNIKGHGGPPFLLLHALMGASDQWFLRDRYHDLRKHLLEGTSNTCVFRKANIKKSIFLDFVQLRFWPTTVTTFGWAISEETCILNNTHAWTRPIRSTGNSGEFSENNIVTAAFEMRDGICIY